MLAALTVSLHYYCQINECSTELQQICHYTTPSSWNELLLKHNTLYRESLSPALLSVHEEYSSRIKPHLLTLGGDIHHKVYSPVVASVKKQYAEFDYQKHCDWISKKTAGIRRQLWFYYNVVVKPYAQKLIYYCKIDQVCSKVHAKLGPFLERIRFVWYYLEVYTTKARSSLTQGYSDLKSLYFHSSHWMTDGKFSEKSNEEAELSSSSDSESETETEEEDDYEEIETSTMTSTVLVTVTLGADEKAIASGGADTSLEVSEQDLLQDDFNAWSHVIDKKSSNIIKLFNKDVDKYVDRKLGELEPIFQNKTQTLSKEAQRHFQIINKAIQEINSTTGTDPETGETIFFDQTGTTQLADYITRPLMRSHFNETRSHLDELTQTIKDSLSELVEEVEKKVQIIRDDLVEVYEEWGDVMISEWTKRLAYIDVVSGHFEADSEENDISAENWKKFLKLKKQVIVARDELAQHPAELKQLKEFLRKVEYILQIVTKESGEYLYILRSRANLAFQDREAQERERKRVELEAQEKEQPIVEQPESTLDSSEHGGKNQPQVDETITEEPSHVEHENSEPVEESLPLAEEKATV